MSVILWFEGRLHEGTRVPFDLADRGLTLGDGVFDTALALSSRVAFEEAHLARLAAAAARLGFALDASAARIGMRALAEAMPDAAIRMNATRGTGPRGLAPPPDPRPIVWGSAAPLRSGFAFAPVRLLPVATRRNETSPCAGLKTLGYLDAVLAAADAKAAGFDDSLFSNTRGRVACAGTGNLFAVIAGALVTPPLADGVLPGIVRAEILAIAREVGIVTSESSLTLRELAAAEAVFMTNSLRGLAPVTAIGEEALASRSHPTLTRLEDGLRCRIAVSCGVEPAAIP